MPLNKKLREDNMNDDRLTIIASSFEEAAIEFHRRKLSSKGYRMDGRIASQRFQFMDGHETKDLFDGKMMFAVSFVKENVKN